MFIIKLTLSEFRGAEFELHEMQYSSESLFNQMIALQNTLSRRDTDVSFASGFKQYKTADYVVRETNTFMRV